MKIEISYTTGQIAAAHPGSVPIFEKFNIDYSTQGGRSLDQACYLAGIPLGEVVQALESLEPPREVEGERDWRNSSMAQIIDHIVEKHHAFTHRQLDLIDCLLGELMESQTLPVPGIARVRECFERMAAHWREHLREEEKVVFPYLVEAERAARTGCPIPRTFRRFNSQTHPLRVMQDENGIMGREWAGIKELAGGFDPPPGSGQELQALYRAFRELERDNKLHMHLENNLLFQRAKQLGLFCEEGVSSAPPRGPW